MTEHGRVTGPAALPAVSWFQVPIGWYVVDAAGLAHRFEGWLPDGRVLLGGVGHVALWHESIRIVEPTLYAHMIIMRTFPGAQIIEVV